MKSFTPGEVISIKATVLRMRDDKVEAQTKDGQLLRIPAKDAMLVQPPKEPKSKATTTAPENKAVTLPENKSGDAGQQSK
jgi:hypothetical protein